MTLNMTSDLPVSPGPATAPPAPPPALLTSRQLMAALGINRRMLKKWNRDRLIPSIGVRHARRILQAPALSAYGREVASSSALMIGQAA